MEADNRYSPGIFRECFQVYEEVGGQEASPLQFRAGDQVLIKLRQEQIRFRSRKDQRLVQNYEGPIEVFKKIGATSYRVALPTWMKIHQVIHVSNLKPYHSDPNDEQRNVITRPSIDLK